MSVKKKRAAGKNVLMGILLAFNGLLSSLAFANDETVNEILNDYPTVARADYVFACMASNDQTRKALENCACSIDHIATILPYDKYVEAEAVLRFLQTGGEKTSVFRSSKSAKDLVDDLRRAQIEAELLCF